MYYYTSYTVLVDVLVHQHDKQYYSNHRCLALADGPDCTAHKAMHLISLHYIGSYAPTVV
jgi:hypothetical protein